MNVDLSYLDLQLLLDLIHKKNNAKFSLEQNHEGHFPDRVRKLDDVDMEALMYCRNPWCQSGQLNIIASKLQETHDAIEAKMKRELDPVGSYVSDVEAAVAAGNVAP